MKLDKKAIDKLLSLNDDQLWSVVKATAARSGMDKLKELERPADMSRLRESIRGLDEKALDKITELLKGGRRNG